LFALFFLFFDLCILMMKMTFRLMKWTIILFVWGLPLLARATVEMIKLMAQLIALIIAGCIALAAAIKRSRDARAITQVPGPNVPAYQLVGPDLRPAHMAAISPTTTVSRDEALIPPIPQSSAPSVESTSSLPTADIVTEGPLPIAVVDGDRPFVAALPSERESAVALSSRGSYIRNTGDADNLAEAAIEIFESDDPVASQPDAPVDINEPAAASTDGAVAPDLQGEMAESRRPRLAQMLAVVALSFAAAAAVMFAVGFSITSVAWIGALGLVPMTLVSFVLSMLAIIFGATSLRKGLSDAARAKRGLVLGIVAFCVPSAGLIITGIAVAAISG